MNKHNISDLYQMQSVPLSVKIRLTESRIRGWVEKYGIDGVYVSFSGGKDSTVLLDICRKLYPNMLAVFIDTGLEYPEIREFVKTFDNVEWLKPKQTFKQVITKYGYPFINKEVSERVYGARRYLEDLENFERERVRYAPYMADLLGVDRRENKENQEYLNLKKGIIPKETTRFQQLIGTYKSAGGGKSAYNYSRYSFLLDAPFKISARCCNVMKKSPAHSFGKKTGRYPITAQLASESRLRTQAWLKNGCNGFDMKSPISNPMAFWTEQDVLLYIKENNLPICSVYGEVVEVGENTSWVKDKDMLGLFDLDRPLLDTTGCKRTGCVFCAYGAHCKGDERFVRLKETHPQLYDYLMRPSSEGGLNYKAMIDWINENGNLNIKY